MRIPLSWLKEFVDLAVEPERLGHDLTLAGLELASIERHGTEVVLDLEITTNRVDCMNVYGVAREVSVLYDLRLRPLDLTFREVGPAGSESLEVRVEAPDLCPRFCGRVMDVHLGPSPPWMRERLDLVGVRAINNVVDLSNYVMMEMGHPSHAFDLACIPRGELHVRWARAGERLTTLDGTTRELHTRVGVVAGSEEPLALAGIMGGASSEVSDRTKVLALEAAYWEPLTIRRGAKALGMRTEASHRFERGADPEGPVSAIARVAHLMETIGAGTTRPGLIDQRPAPGARRWALLRPARLGLVLGTPVPERETHRILQGLGFLVAGREQSGTRFEIPTWRGDVSREADLIEEVARHYGLDRIPSTLPPSGRPGSLALPLARERAIREVLVASGLSEVINLAFAAPRADGEDQVRIENPLAQDQAGLRTSLVLPGLLTCLQRNLRQGRRDVGLFELGRVFLPTDGLPQEQRRLGILVAGQMRPGHWSERGRSVDFFDLKGILEAVGRRLGARLDLTRDGVAGFLHPARAAVLLSASQPVGYVGSLHPALAQQWEVRDEVLVAELTLDGLLERAAAPVHFRALARFPAVNRDLSIVCDSAVSGEQLEGLVRSSGGDHVVSAGIVDRYDGAPIPAGKVGLTMTVRFQDPQRTLTGEEVQASMERIVRALHEAGVEIRGG